MKSKDFSQSLDKMPNLVKEEFAKMSLSKQEAFKEEYFSRAKCLVISYIAGLFFGTHYLYCKKLGQQALLWVLLGIAATYLIVVSLFIRSFPTLTGMLQESTVPFLIWIAVMGFFSIIGIAWWVVSLIKMPCFIKNYNRGQALVSLRNINSLGV